VLQACKLGTVQVLQAWYGRTTVPATHSCACAPWGRSSIDVDLRQWTAVRYPRQHDHGWLYATTALCCGGLSAGPVPSQRTIVILADAAVRPAVSDRSIGSRLGRRAPGSSLLHAPVGACMCYSSMIIMSALSAARRRRPAAARARGRRRAAGLLQRGLGLARAAATSGAAHSCLGGPSRCLPLVSFLRRRCWKRRASIIRRRRRRRAAGVAAVCIQGQLYLPPLPWGLESDEHAHHF
jgi:hypothetical protein